MDSDWKSEPFDFLIDGELVRLSLEEFLIAKGISAVSLFFFFFLLCFLVLITSEALGAELLPILMFELFWDMVYNLGITGVCDNYLGLVYRLTAEWHIVFASDWIFYSVTGVWVK